MRTVNCQRDSVVFSFLLHFGDFVSLVFFGPTDKDAALKTAMAPKQRMRIANEKASKMVTMRGNVPKTSVSVPYCTNFLGLL